MNQPEVTNLYRMRRKAQRESGNWHVYPVSEETLHTLEITQAELTKNAQCTLTPRGQVCFCEPMFEDYTDNGGGQLIVHQRVVWQ